MTDDCDKVGEIKCEFRKRGYGLLVKEDNDGSWTASWYHGFVPGEAGSPHATARVSAPTKLAAAEAALAKFKGE